MAFTAEQIAKELGKAQKAGTGWKCLCPVHPDAMASLGLKDGAGGKILVQCYASCDNKAVIEELKRRKLWPESRKKKDLTFRVTHRYTYQRADGSTAYQSVRRQCVEEPEKKTFFQRAPKPGLGREPNENVFDDWIADMTGVERVLFRLPRINEAIATGKPIFIVEGEKDVLTLEAWGLTATCNVGGAAKDGEQTSKKWLESYTDSLVGAKMVVILTDNDPAGRKHGAYVATSLFNKKIPCRVVQVPFVQVDDKTDVTDWKERGGSLPELKKLCQAAPAFEPVVAQIFGDAGNPPAGKEERAPLPYTTEELGPVYDTDTYNGVRLVRLHGEDMRYTVERGWMVWDGKRFQPDPKAILARRKAKDVASAILVEYGLADQQTRADVFKWAKKSHDNARIKAMLEAAESEPGVAVSLNEFDKDPYILNCANGVLDLRTGRTEGYPTFHKQHDRNFKCTKIIPVEYDDEAVCPKWDAFLFEAMGGLEEREGAAAEAREMEAFLQRAIGYTLTGLTDEQVLFFTHGPGGNGKSVLLEVLQYLMGEYGASIPTESLMMRHNPGIPNEIAALVGTRFVAANETSQGQRLDEARIKDLTGSDTIPARFMRAEWFNFKPNFKLWMRGNHRPVIKNQDEGIWRRLLLIPFMVTPRDKNQQLVQELIAEEMPGILAWAVRGAMLWMKKGLCPPDRVLLAGKQYRSDMDVLGTFLAERYSDANKFAWVSAKEFHETYSKWCDDYGHHRMSQQSLKPVMEQKGFKYKIDDTFGAIWQGLEQKARFVPQTTSG